MKVSTNISRHLFTTLFLFLICLTLSAQDTEHVRLTNLPHIYINTFDGRSITSKTTYVYATMWYVDENDVVTQYDSLEIRGRGNSTWSLAKKPYRIKFHQKEKLLGKGYAKTKKWNLLANHGDKTLIRNAVTFLLGEKAGLKFNPALKFVDLTLNGRYVGNYQLTDAIDVRPHRVDVTEQDLPLADTSNITGGYLLEADGFKDFVNGKSGFYTWLQNVPIRIHYPDEDDIATTQYQYIQQHVQTFENRLYSQAFTDPSEGYRPFVDSTSLVNWYICTEISGNIDGFYSTYFYKEQDDQRLFWGPLWDYDIAYANDDRKGDTSQQLMRDVGYGALRQWIVQMWQDPWFASLINRRYQQLVADGMEDYLYEKIDSLTLLMEASVKLNYERWGINTKTLRERVLYSSYDQYIRDLKLYISRHVPYLKDMFASLAPEEQEPDPEPEPEPEPIIAPFASKPNYYYRFTNVGAGTCIDVNTATERVVGNSKDAGSETQQWQLLMLSNGYYHIVNRATGMALNDPTEGVSTATTNVGAQLGVADADSTDQRQLWLLVQQGTDRYNLTNAYTDHTANLSGGSSQNGTSILSYTNDARNSSSNNRQWLIAYSDSIAETADGIGMLPKYADDMDYALAYDPASCRLHFGCDDLSALSFKVAIYDQQGRRVMEFHAPDGANLTSLPRGLYIVAWSYDGRRNSVKLQR